MIGQEQAAFFESHEPTMQDLVDNERALGAQAAVLEDTNLSYDGVAVKPQLHSGEDLDCGARDD